MLHTRCNQICIAQVFIKALIIDFSSVITKNSVLAVFIQEPINYEDELKNC